MGQGRRLGLRAALPSGSRGVALTFDDGPGPETEQLLDVLAEADVRATFFVTGAHLRARPAVAARIVTDGHLLANHTWSHPQDVAGSTPRGDFDLLPRDEQARQMDDTTAEIVARATVGAPPDSILLFHDGKASAEPEEVISSYRGHTVAAVEAVIAHYRAAGQVFCDPDGRRL